MDGTGYPLHAAFVVVYLLALIGVGAIKARKVKSQEDFSLAGRSLPTFVLIGTLLATWIGTGSIFGNAEETYNVGVPAFWLPVGSAVGIIALYMLAARIRRFGQFTIQDILEARFGIAARILGTLTLLGAYVIIVSYQYRAGQAVLGYLFPELSREVGIICVAVFVILYTALAGMFSVAYTDVVNGILIVIGIAIAIPMLLGQTGGISGALESLPAAKQSIGGHYSTLGLLSVVLPPFLLVIGDANMYQRFFSAKDENAARRSAGWMFVGVAVLECAIIATALLGSALVAQGKLDAPETTGHIVVAVAFDALPALLGAMLVGTVIAVVVSTADSYLLSPATSLVRDVYQRFLVPDADEKRVVFVGRATVVVLGLIALGLAFMSDEFFHVALFAYTIYGAGITPVVLAAFFWPRATPAGAVAGMLSGVGTSLAWKQDLFGVATGVQEALGEAVIGPVVAALPVALIALVVVSLLGAPPDPEKARAI